MEFINIGYELDIHTDSCMIRTFKTYDYDYGGKYEYEELFRQLLLDFSRTTIYINSEETTSLRETLEFIGRNFLLKSNIDLVIASLTQIILFFPAKIIHDKLIKVGYCFADNEEQEPIYVNLTEYSVSVMKKVRGVKVQDSIETFNQFMVYIDMDFITQEVEMIIICEKAELL